MLPLAAAVQPVLRDVAAPVLRELAEGLGCTAHLTVADGGEALALAVVEPSWTDFHVSYRIGARHPLDQGAAGKAILLGRSSRSDSAAYVMTAGELQPGARGLAAPILGLAGLEASVGIVTLGDLDADQVGAKVVAAASRLGGLRLARHSRAPGPGCGSIRRTSSTWCPAAQVATTVMAAPQSRCRNSTGGPSGSAR